MTETPAPAISVAHVIENCVGCKWTLHVLAQVRAGVRRPGQLERSAEGLTAKVLAERLLKLVRFRILEKRSFPEVPPRVEYHLTEFGQRLLGLLDQVEELQREWGGTVAGQETDTAPGAAPHPAG